MYQAKIPLENYVGASWLAEQCNVSKEIVHRYAIKQKLRYFLFLGSRYLERNDAIALVKQLSKQDDTINLPNIVSAIEHYHCSGSLAKNRSA